MFYVRCVFKQPIPIFLVESIGIVARETPSFLLWSIKSFIQTEQFADSYTFRDFTIVFPYLAVSGIGMEQTLALIVRVRKNNGWIFCIVDQHFWSTALISVQFNELLRALPYSIFSLYKSLLFVHDQLIIQKEKLLIPLHFLLFGS